MHERQPWLWVPSGLVRVHEGILRTGNVAPHQPNATEFRQRPSELATQVRTQLFAGKECFHFGFFASPTKPQDLSPMNAATPVDTSHRLPLSPPLHGFGPLLSLVVLGERLERTHDFAIDEPRVQRFQLTRD